jgi:hypothetical protein
MPVIPATTGSTNRRLMIQVGLGIKRNPTSKITNTKKASRVAQVEENLPSKYKALSSIPSTEAG